MFSIHLLQDGPRVMAATQRENGLLKY